MQLSKRPFSRFIEKDDPLWPTWIEICNYTGWNPDGPLKPILYHGFVMPSSATLNVSTHFYDTLTEMINNIKAIRIAIVGPAGVGKTYMAIHIARILERNKFSIDQIVFSREDYVRLARTLKPKKSIIIEEPTYIMASRSWFDVWQQSVIRTIESSRFQNNPLIIPVVNRNLLDKTIRNYYITHVIEMRSRGVGKIFTTSYDQWEAKLWRKGGTTIYAYWPGVEMARCGRTTCLDCKELPTCDKFIWPKYERKRKENIERYHEQDEQRLREVSSKKSQGEQFQERFDQAVEIRDDLIDKDKYSVPEIMYRTGCNRVMGQLIANLLKKRYPVSS